MRNQSSTICGPNSTGYAWLSVGDRAATLWITPTVKQRRGSAMVDGGFCLLLNRGFVPGEGDFELDWLSYGSITRSHLEHGLWLKDLKSCKIITQSILVNSARGTFKAEEQQVLQQMPCPAQSVDINLIELVWDEHDRQC